MSLLKVFGIIYVIMLVAFVGDTCKDRFNKDDKDDDKK